MQGCSKRKRRNSNGGNTPSTPRDQKRTKLAASSDQQVSNSVRKSERSLGKPCSVERKAKYAHVNNQVQKDPQEFESQENFSVHTPSVMAPPTIEPLTPKCIDKTTFLPDKYNLLVHALDALHVFSQFRRRNQNSWCWFKDVKPFVEKHTNREFTMEHLARLKTLLGEGMLWEFVKKNNQLRFRFTLNQQIQDQRVLSVSRRQLQVSELYRAQRRDVKNQLVQIRNQVLAKFQNQVVGKSALDENSGQKFTINDKLNNDELGLNKNSEKKQDLQVIGFEDSNENRQMVENLNEDESGLNKNCVNLVNFENSKVNGGQNLFDVNSIEFPDIEKCPLPDQHKKRQSLTTSVTSPKDENQKTNIFFPINNNKINIQNKKNTPSSGRSNDMLRTPGTLDRRLSLESSSVHGRRLSFEDSLASKLALTPSDRKKIDENVLKFARRISFDGKLDEQTMKAIEEKEIQSFVNSKVNIKQSIKQSLSDRLLGQIFDSVRSIFGSRGSRVRKFDDLVKQLYSNMGENYEVEEVNEQLHLLVERLPECFVKKMDENGVLVVQFERSCDAGKARKKLMEKRAKNLGSMLSPTIE